MQVAPRYDDVVSEVAAFLEERLAFAVAAGIAEERICLDPGIGFGKTPDQNLELVRRLDGLVALGRPVLVGLSRKSHARARRSATRTRASGTVAASVGAAVAAFDRGATLFRVHDVRAHVEALTRRRGRRARVASRVTIELRGIELHGYHGVLEDERQRRPAVPRRPRARPRGRRAAAETTGSRTPSTTATSSRSSDEVSDGRAYNLLEALATALADALLERFAVARVRVRVRKPDVVLELPVEHAAVSVERSRRRRGATVSAGTSRPRVARAESIADDVAPSRPRAFRSGSVSRSRVPCPRRGRRGGRVAQRAGHADRRRAGRVERPTVDRPTADASSVDGPARVRGGQPDAVDVARVLVRVEPCRDRSLRGASASSAAAAFAR